MNQTTVSNAPKDTKPVQVNQHPLPVKETTEKTKQKTVNV